MGKDGKLALFNPLVPSPQKSLSFHYREPLETLLYPVIENGDFLLFHRRPKRTPVLSHDSGAAVRWEVRRGSRPVVEDAARCSTSFLK